MLEAFTIWMSFTVVMVLRMLRKGTARFHLDPGLFCARRTGFAIREEADVAGDRKSVV